MVSLNKFRFECVHCGNCCCDQNTIVNTTYSDILRIKNGLSTTINEMLEILSFYIYVDTPSSKNLLKMVIHPIQTENGLAFIGLRKNNSGSCIFYNYEKRRCAIYTIRPCFCRTFPFYFYLENSIVNIGYTKKGLEYCQGISDNYKMIDKEYWTDLGKKVLDDLIQNDKFINHWNQEVNKQKIKPTAKGIISSIFKMGINDKNIIKSNE